MKCYKCGHNAEDNAVFCGNCGASLISGDSSNEENNVVRRKKKKGIVPIVIIFISLVLAASAAAGYVLYSRADTDDMDSVQRNNSKNKKDDYSTPSAVPVPTPTPTPVPTQSVSDNSSYPQLSSYVDSDGYGTYTSSINGFHSKYPADFDITLCTDKMLSCVAADNGDLDIVWDYSDGKSINQKYQEFIDSCMGEVEYKSVGSNYYAVRILYRSIYTYQFRKVENGIEYGFSMSFPYDKFDKYDTMVNVIYQSMKDQF